MKFRWLVTLLLIVATSCTNQSQTPEATQSNPAVSLTPEASPTLEASATSASVAQNNLPTLAGGGGLTPCENNFGYGDATQQNS